MKLKKTTSNFQHKILNKRVSRWWFDIHLNAKSLLRRSCFVNYFCIFQFVWENNISQSVNFFQVLEKRFLFFFSKRYPICTNSTWPLNKLGAIFCFRIRDIQNFKNWLRNVKNTDCSVLKKSVQDKSSVYSSNIYFKRTPYYAFLSLKFATFFKTDSF